MLELKISRICISLSSVADETAVFCILHFQATRNVNDFCMNDSRSSLLFYRFIVVL